MSPTMIIQVLIACVHLCSGAGQQHGSPGSTGQMAPPMNRPSEEPTLESPDDRQPIHPSLPSCDGHCRNGGTCVRPTKAGYQCKCLPLFVGEKCETEIKPPRNITLVEAGLHQLTVSWLPPDEGGTIHGYVIQYHPFGDKNAENRSELILPDTKQYTLKGLKEDTHYTVCINIIQDNTTFPDAVLRDQCLEVTTDSSSSFTSTGSLILIAVVCGAIFATFLLLFVLIACCSKKQQQTDNKQKKLPGGATFPSMSWRRTREMGSYRDQSYLTDNKRNESVLFGDEVLHQNQTNNATSRDGCRGGDDDVFVEPPEPSAYVNRHDLAVRSSSAVETRRVGGPPVDQGAEARAHSSGEVTFDPRFKRSSSLSQANYRELPPSISNHMMRSPTTRDKDATNDFDMGGSFLVHHS